MKMHLDTSSNNLVTDYGVDFISINGVRYEQSIVVNTTSLSSDTWTTDSVLDLTIDDFDTILQSKPELIILGTGKKHLFPEPKLMAEVFDRGCALEIMNTSAACRTYNVLVSEYRKVTAVLLQIKEA